MEYSQFIILGIIAIVGAVSFSKIKNRKNTSNTLVYKSFTKTDRRMTPEVMFFIPEMDDGRAGTLATVHGEGDCV